MCCDYKGFHDIWSLSLTNNGCLFPSLNKKQLFSLYKQKDSQQIDCKITFFLSSQQSYSFNWSSFIAEPCSISLFVFCLSFCIQQEIKSVTLKRPSNKNKNETERRIFGKSENQNLHNNSTGYLRKTNIWCSKRMLFLINYFFLKKNVCMYKCGLLSK